MSIMFGEGHRRRELYPRNARNDGKDKKSRPRFDARGTKGGFL